VTSIGGLESYAIQITRDLLAQLLLAEMRGFFLVIRSIVGIGMNIRQSGLP
jgi:hypothetical protein